MALTKTTVGVTNIADLSSTPNATEGLTAAQLQAKFDKTGADLKTYINDTLTVEQDTINTAIETRTSSGWTPTTGTYASASTITVASGAVSKYSVGDKIKLTQTTIKYFYVTTVADTLLTVTGGSDYTVANATITDMYYSHEESPTGFPTYFNFVPTLAGDITAGTGTYILQKGLFTLKAKKVYYDFKLGLSAFSGGSGLFKISGLPFTAKAGTTALSILMCSGAIFASNTIRVLWWSSSLLISGANNSIGGLVVGDITSDTYLYSSGSMFI